jgi:hypothetical protein
VAKTQIPVVGGIRKVVKTPEAITPGTTIAEYGSGTITLAQLRQALGVIVTKPNTQGGGGGGAGATIVPGPGLSGGGPVLGNVPINLTAPIPVFIFEEGGGGDSDAAPIPGQTGPAGAGTTGAAGPMGPAIFLLADDPDEALNAIPGSVGPQGANSTVPGPAGPAGQTVAFIPDDFDIELPFVPPSIQLRTVNKGANWVSSVAIVAGSANKVYVSCPVAGTINRVKVVTSGGSGSCVIDVWKAPFASFPPLVANSIVAAAPPTISGGTTYTESTLAGWTRAINAGDVLAFSLTSSSTFTQIEIVLEIQQNG